MHSMTRWVSKRSIGVVLMLAATLLVTVCSFSSNLLSVNAHPSALTRAFAILNHSPQGTAGLLWSESNHTLIVTVTLSGLAPSSTHPDAIHIGDCNSPTHGPVANNGTLGLNPVNADSTGKGSSVTTFPNVLEGIPAQGWYVDVHDGPELADNLQQERIACADVVNPNALISAPEPPSSSPSTTTNGTISTQGPTPTPPNSESPPPPNNGAIPSVTNNQVVNVTLGGSADDNQSVTVGGVELSLTNHHHGSSGLTVRIFLFRLAPDSTHMAHIHSGSCDSQGPVVEPLNPVHADSIGFGTSTTFLSGVSSIPDTGWYVNVHLASTMDGLGDQTGFDPIACGNIAPSDSSPSTTSVNPVTTPTPFIE